MVPNGAAYNNFPPFGTNGTKTPPGGTTESAKYALGMVPADTFPAEWANYLFYGATQGITRLNQDTGSIKKEINSVLSNFNITPDATDNDQLLEALNKLKAEAALAAHPVGSLYWTSVNENPATTFGGGTWEQIKDKFILAAGDTYSQGATGGSATVTLTAEQMPSHYHSVGSHTHTLGGSTGNAGSHSHTTNSISATRTGGMSAHATDGWFGQGSRNGVQYATDGTTFKSTTTLVTGLAPSYDSDARKVTLNIAHTHDMNHTHGTNTVDAHNHSLPSNTGGCTAFNSGSTGGSNGTTQAHNNMPPYIVQYCWKRTA